MSTKKIFNDTAELFYLIEEGMLVRTKDVPDRYHMSEEEVGEALREGQFGQQHKLFGTTYVLSQAVELYMQNVGHRE